MFFNWLKCRIKKWKRTDGERIKINLKEGIKEIWLKISKKIQKRQTKSRKIEVHFSKKSIRNIQWYKLVKIK